MTKKEYLKPAIDVIEIDFKQQMLTGSLTDLVTNGLGDDVEDKILFGDEEGNPWDDAF